MRESTYIIYYCIMSKRYEIERNRGWPIQEEQNQHSKKDARMQADEMNRILSNRKNMKEITIKAKIPDRWINDFCSMLKEMEYLGKIGSSRHVCIYSDGDGDFHPEFDIDTEFKRIESYRTSNDERMFDAE